MKLLHVARSSMEAETYIQEGCIANDDRWLCLSDTNQSIRCYDLRTANFTLQLADHTTMITDLASMDNGRTLLSSQQDTGVMISDLRAGKAVHFLTELTDTNLPSYSLSVNPAGDTLALAVDRSVHLIDTRTWSSIRLLEDIHTDEVTRVRWCGDTELCTAGEDHMINFFDTTQRRDNDLMVSMINCEEVITRMNWMPEFDCMAMIGSCENAYIAPTDLTTETKIARPNFETYMVDFVSCRGEMLLVGGNKDDDGNACALWAIDAKERNEVGRFDGAHTEQARVAIGFGGDRIVTAGEDGVVGFWTASDEEVVTAAEGSRMMKESHKDNSNSAMAMRRKRKPY